MKRIIIIAGSVFTMLFLVFMVIMYVWIGNGIKENISIAKKKYPGNAEDALISILLDENNSPNDRTHIAIWTLGQLKSEKALPILKGLYKNDPEGKTCHGRHTVVICQYGLYKAIKIIEKGGIFSYERLKK